MQRFIVSEDAGLYTITLQSGSGLSVGLAPPGVAVSTFYLFQFQSSYFFVLQGDSLKWQRNPYQWNIIPLSPGVWKYGIISLKILLPFR